MFSNFLLSNYFNAFSFIKNWCKLHGNLSTCYHYLYFGWYAHCCDIFSQKKTIYVCDSGKYDRNLLPNSNVLQSSIVNIGRPQS